VGDFNKMMKELGVEDCHLLPLKRYLHDAGWIRFYAFKNPGATLKPRVE